MAKFKKGDKFIIVVDSRGGFYKKGERGIVWRMVVQFLS